MKNLVRQAVVTAFALLAAAGTASAADVWVPPARGPIVEPVPVEFGSNWYLRADVGYRFKFNDTEISAFGVSADINEDGSDDGWTIGAGVGYRFNPWIRTDVTADYGSETELRGHLDVDPDFGLRADLTTWTVLANGYVDLGTWSRITPYVGAGLGASHMKMENGASYFIPTGAPLDGPLSASEWAFSWALMAGAAFDVTSNLSVDLGYRYLNIGDIKYRDELSGVEGRLEDLSAHEARIGVRYMIN